MGEGVSWGHVEGTCLGLPGGGGMLGGLRWWGKWGVRLVFEGTWGWYALGGVRRSWGGGRG